MQRNKTHPTVQTLITESSLRYLNSFHGSLPKRTDELPQMNPPENRSEILLRRIRSPFETSVSSKSTSSDNSHKLTKFLVNVTIERSLGPVRVVMPLENTAKDLIKAVLDVYVKEKRRPFLTETDPQCFELHYSQFSLESLNQKEKIINLGSRNFFLCSNRTKLVDSSCLEQANKAAAIKSPFPWTRLMEFLL